MTPAVKELFKSVNICPSDEQTFSAVISWGHTVCCIQEVSISCRPDDQLVSPSRPEVVAQLAVARLVCRPDDRAPTQKQSTINQQHARVKLRVAAPDSQTER